MNFQIFFLFLFCLNLSIEMVSSQNSNQELIEELIRTVRIKNAKEINPLSQSKLTLLIHAFNKIDGKSCSKLKSCGSKWIKLYNLLLKKTSEANAVLNYKYLTNITDENLVKCEEFAIIKNEFNTMTLLTAKLFLNNSKNWNPEIHRMFLLASRGSLIKDPKQAVELTSLEAKLEKIYATAKVCLNDEKPCLSLEPSLTRLFTTSRDYDLLLSAWKGWRDATGPKMRESWHHAIEIKTKSARTVGYSDISEVWLEDYEEKGFEKQMNTLFEEHITPLYQQLHAYTRRKLKGFYGAKYPNSHFLQAHLLGNMWGQNWENIFDILVPYPNVKSENITDRLISLGFTPQKLFEEAENFFTSIGLYEMTPNFWKYSMFKKPKNREVQCHASAWDFSNKYDFRIKMCSEVDESSFSTAHHEMGHIQYYMCYKNQPSIFKSGANSGFHEAIGDTINLSVLSTTHLKKIGILSDSKITHETEINKLMKMALNKIAFLPFGYLMDKFRFGVFRGEINSSNYNQKWWEMRKAYQGFEAPINRTENDFDPGAKYHIASFTPYSRYFVSHLLQFQFYKALCNLADHRGQLHQCDFYGSKRAGQKFKKMMKLGSSEHWKLTLKELTGEGELSVKPLLEYFKPLIDWLVKENQKYPEDKIGW